MCRHDDTAEDRNGTSRVASNGNLKRFGVMPSFGDLDTMVERRIVRVLTVYGPGRYFLEDGPRCTVQEYADKLQEVINETFRTGLLTVQVAVIPVSRDQLFPALENGYGDIVMAGTTITDTHRESANFTDPVSRPLREILITGPSAPAIGWASKILQSSTVHPPIQQLRRQCASVERTAEGAGQSGHSHRSRQ